MSEKIECTISYSIEEREEQPAKLLLTQQIAAYGPSIELVAALPGYMLWQVKHIDGRFAEVDIQPLLLKMAKDLLK